MNISLLCNISNNFYRFLDVKRSIQITRKRNKSFNSFYNRRKATPFNISAIGTLIFKKLLLILHFNTTYSKMFL